MVSPSNTVLNARFAIHKNKWQHWTWHLCLNSCRFLVFFVHCFIAACGISSGVHLNNSCFFVHFVCVCCCFARFLFHDVARADGMWGLSLVRGQVDTNNNNNAFHIRTLIRCAINKEIALICIGQICGTPAMLNCVDDVVKIFFFFFWYDQTMATRLQPPCEYIYVHVCLFCCCCCCGANWAGCFWVHRSDNRRRRNLHSILDVFKLCFCDRSLDISRTSAGW